MDWASDSVARSPTQTAQAPGREGGQPAGGGDSRD